MIGKEKIVATFAKIECGQIPVSAVFCGVCGNRLTKNTKPCVHQTELINQLKAAGF